jgi:hypothetical protein
MPKKPKPSQAQEEVLVVLANGGIIRADWITHRFSLADAQGFHSTVPKRTMEALTRNNWVAWNKDKKKRMGDMNDEYLITEEGRSALR